MHLWGRKCWFPLPWSWNLTPWFLLPSKRTRCGGLNFATETACCLVKGIEGNSTNIFVATYEPLAAYPSQQVNSGLVQHSSRTAHLTYVWTCKQLIMEIIERIFSPSRWLCIVTQISECTGEMIGGTAFQPPQSMQFKV